MKQALKLRDALRKTLRERKQINAELSRTRSTWILHADTAAATSSAAAADSAFIQCLRLAVLLSPHFVSPGARDASHRIKCVLFQNWNVFSKSTICIQKSHNYSQCVALLVWFIKDTTHMWQPRLFVPSDACRTREGRIRTLTKQTKCLLVLIEQVKLDIYHIAHEAMMWSNDL